jgi:hypothetical protein
MAQTLRLQTGTPRAGCLKLWRATRSSEPSLGCVSPFVMAMGVAEDDHIRDTEERPPAATLVS